jgi:tRNA pseudouridine55 synthase
MTLEDYQAGHLFVVDKPETWSSFSVVNKIKFLLKHRFSIKKIKVGHAGTLDPFATGVLVVCIGKMTKQIHHFVDTKKSYSAIFKLGEISDTYDKTGNIIANNYEIPDLATIKSTVEDTFIGQIQQTPPMFSAKKVDGQRLYKLARQGKEVERKKSDVIIYKYEVSDLQGDLLYVNIDCSKGTYIRSLAHDLGELLGCGAYCKELRRTRVGDFDIKDAMSIEEVKAFIDQT